MPKSPPARSPLILMGSNIWVKDEFNSHGVAKPVAINVREDYGNYLLDAANLLPEIVYRLQHHHSVTNANDFEQTGYLHDPKPCPTCKLISRAKEALGQ